MAEANRMLILLLTVIAFIGCVNWAFYAIKPDYNLVKLTLGKKGEETPSMGERIVYILVALAGIGLLTLRIQEGQQGASH